MKRSFVLLLLLSLSLSGRISYASPESEKQISQAVIDRRFDTAVTELLKFRSVDEAAFLAKDNDYLLGRMAEASGDLGLAMASFQSVANRDSALKPYALKRISQIARSSGNLLLERLYLNEILVFAPNSLIAKSASLRLARNGFESSNYAQAIEILTRSGITAANPKKSVDTATIRETKGLLGEAYLRNNEVERSRVVFAELLDSTPNAAQPDDIALVAVQNLDVIFGGEKGKRAPQLVEAEHVRRGWVYQFNREFSDAKLHYDTLIASYPAGTTTAEAIFQIGRGFAQQANFVEALKWFERVVEQFPQSNAAKDALLQAASAYGRVGRPKEATTRYETFIAKYPNDERLDRAYLNIVDILRDQGQDTDAIRECEKIREVFRGKLPEAIALFTEARIYFAREEWQNAHDVLERLKTFTELGGSSVPGGTSVTEITFLRGYSLEQLKRYPQAIETYLSIHDGRGEYYGWRASERIKAMVQNEAAAPFVTQAVGRFATQLSEHTEKLNAARAILRLSDAPAVREKAIEVLKGALPPLPKNLESEKKAIVTPKTPTSVAEKLIALGLHDEAVNEIEATSEKTGSVLNTFKLGDRADLVVAAVEPIWRSVPADHPLDLLPREQLELLYPAPYAHFLVKYASERAVDPRLLLSIMRQESRFQPTAKSNAAARGLMQFISTTSNKIANDLGRENFRQDELYYPPTAVLFGSQYLADLLKVFPDQSDAVVASYNGGDDNMKRWLNRSRSSIPERYVPEVVYAQSKDYVHKVMASYRVYKYLYDEQLKPIGEQLAAPQASSLHSRG